MRSFIVLSIWGAGSASATDINESFKPYLGGLSADVAYWFESAFKSYKHEFIEPNGRVFDPQNGGITHSESQGYGMMLALLGNDQATFEQIWSFTKDELQRADGLFAWKFVPGRGVTDRNNATDGELFIATALAWRRSAGAMRCTCSRHSASPTRSGRS